MRKHLGWALLALWAVSLLTALLVYGQRQLSSFDPDGKLLHLSTAPSFDTKLVQLLHHQNIKAGSVVHVGTTSRCYCESLTSPHQNQLLASLGEGYQSVRLNIDEVPALQAMLHAVPALLVLDNQNQLRYLGPYATGYGCFTGKNLVEQVVSYATQSPYNGAVINADAQGCFC